MRFSCTLITGNRASRDAWACFQLVRKNTAHPKSWNGVHGVAMLPSALFIFRRATNVASYAELVAIAACIPACGASTDATAVFEERDGITVFPAQIVASTLSQTGHYSVELRSAPAAAPARGENRVQLTVLASSDQQAIADLSIELRPFMPAMGHGSAIDPDLAWQKAGEYEFRQVWLNMPGRWQLITSIEGEIEDQVTFEFDIQ